MLCVDQFAEQRAQADTELPGEFAAITGEILRGPVEIRGFQRFQRNQLIDVKAGYGRLAAGGGGRCRPDFV